jgi:YidC/Oxa1 family membrane protein insertase
MEQQQRNLFIAIAVSIVILLGFQFLFERPHLERQQQAQQAQQAQPGTAPQQSAPTPGGQAPATTGAPPAAAPSPGAPAGPAPANREAALRNAPRLKIKTGNIDGSVALLGGRIDDVRLARYRETVDPQSPEIVLLSPTGAPEPYFAEFGWIPAKSGVKLPGPDTRWTASADTLTPDAPVQLTWDNGEGLKFTRTIAVDRNFMFTLTQRVENTGSEPVGLLPYALIQRTGTPHTAGYYILHEGPVGVFDGKLKEPSYKDLQGGNPIELPTTGGWLGITDKYWLTALVPDQKEEVKGHFTHTLRDKTDIYQADFLGTEREVPAGGSIETNARFFAGAKEVKLLESYEDAGITRFADAVDWGWFFFLTKPIFHLLEFFYRQIGNFGLGILLLTVIIKALFFPLANKSYAAMAKMKTLQPQMQELREKFGDDKARLNQEMMALYKRVGANPLAGCLPIVIQIPVFFSLYKVLFVTIEMRHAPFYGWIRDLSAPDPTTFVNLFGLLPFDPPSTLAFLHIGAWPLIMGVTMWLQQKLNPQPPDPVQAKMFMLLPFIFTYMLSQFAAGLVIYWAWNNLLSIAQQWVIMRKNKAV